MVQAPPPEIGEDEAARLAQDLFGVVGTAHSLGSNQDLNFVIDTGAADRLLLKIANPATDPAELEAQSRAAGLIGSRAGVRVPLARTFSDGTTVRPVTTPDGGTAHARMLPFLSGDTLGGSGYLAPDVIARFGTLAASVDTALAGWRHPGTERDNQWDLRHAPAVLADLLPSVADDDLRRHLRQTADAAWARIAPVAASLPQQVIHGDLTDDNVVATDGRMPDGVIDLGDLGRTWRVGELAITLTGILHHDGVSVADALAAVTAYQRVLPLTDDELDVLWPLVAVRGAVLVASAHHVLRTDPGNAYAAENLLHEQLILAAATSLPLPVATALVRQAAGVPVTAPSVPAAQPMLAGPVAVVDLSPASPALDEGRWLEPDIEHVLAQETLAAGAATVVTRFAEPRLSRAHPGQHAAAVVVPGIDVTVAGPAVLTAPWAGEIELVDEGLELRAPHGGLVLRITAAHRGHVADRSGERVAAGDPVAEITGTVRVTLAEAGIDVPEAVTAQTAAAWRAVVADPTAVVFGDAVAPASAPADAGELLRRRERSLAEVQEHYFADPPVIVRGWREYLVDADARVYLDALNNVSSIGHAHPRLVEAVAAQWRLINTNSRFHYPQIVEFAERLAATLPDGLDQVFLVNSGSEAVDLALRLAQAHTSRPDILAVAEAYHGWTYLSDAVSTSVADNPHALETRPAWVHTVEAPNPFRGRYRGSEAARYADDAVAEVHRLAEAGTPVGAFLAESIFGNAGGMPLPDGYLKAVYAAVRAGGGVAVADEVQVGYGRLGEWFWGFQQQDAVPDIVAVAKAMGAGHPLGAVITSKRIAASYRSQGYFFSSAGGSPVSSVVGLTVLDVIRDEGLQQNAAEVGAYLKQRLTELGERYPILGTVHGYGFYLGPEFVRDRESWTPATEETARICDRLRRLGVMIQPTGDHQNVLKFKPPMCFTRDSADEFIAALTRVLETGW
ncbi:4-aminobutyrate aminotransferase [Microbacterium mangrovi]|uniref:4-aminobutyrate aminotransferase n=1 Tax=Microbacterium mangrovi TaxID=1348253 RepID=A0A0B2ABI7_9MICO|nr:4-aminobutyrate aminotransferase [Microbacterium mangrovi]